MTKEDGNSILLIDDHELIVVGLKTILENCPLRLSPIDSAVSGKEALQRMREHTYDLYIIDIEMPDINGFELIRIIRKHNPQARIIVNTIHEEIWFFRQLERYDVNGIVCKSLDTEVITEAVATVLDNRKYYCRLALPEQGKKSPSPLFGNELSKSEIKVLQSIAKGLTTAEIAEQLFVTKNTIQSHRQHINEKLGTTNVAGMIIQGLKLGLLDVE